METAKRPAEGRVLLRNVGWETYETLLDEREERRVPRFYYDRGVLEIVSPSAEHESVIYFLELLVAAVAEETGVDAYGAGSTTFKRQDLERGFEPDACFYIRNEERVRGKKRIDLAVDPPPDLVIEVDVTNPSLDKLPLYAWIGVPEVWRHDGGKVSVFALEGGEYTKVARSIALPPLTGEVISGFIKDSASLGSASWLRNVREWVRTARL